MISCSGFSLEFVNVGKMTFAVSLIIRTDAEYLVVWGLLDSLFHSMCSMEKGDFPKQSNTFFKYLSRRGFGF